MKRVVNAFLQLLDDYESISGLLVAATNLTKTLDEAVWRRFDDAVEVPKPTKPEIEGILRQTLSSVSIGGINWQATIQSLENLSAAQIVQIAHLKFLKSGTAISGKSPCPSNHCVEDED